MRIALVLQHLATKGDEGESGEKTGNPEKLSIAAPFPDGTRLAVRQVGITLDESREALRRLHPRNRLPSVTIGGPGERGKREKGEGVIESVHIGT